MHNKHGNVKQSSWKVLCECSRGYMGAPQHQAPPVHMGPMGTGPPEMRGPPMDMRGPPMGEPRNMMGDPRGPPRMEQRGPPMETRGKYSGIAVLCVLFFVKAQLHPFCPNVM